MSTKKARESFKEMLNICYDENYPELHNELISLEREIKKDKEPYKFERGMRELLTLVPLFADDLSPETSNQLDEVYGNFLENE